MNVFGTVTTVCGPLADIWVSCVYNHGSTILNYDILSVPFYPITH